MRIYENGQKAETYVNKFGHNNGQVVEGDQSGLVDRKENYTSLLTN